MTWRKTWIVLLLLSLYALLGLSFAMRKHRPFDVIFWISIAAMIILVIAAGVVGAFRERRARLMQWELDQKARRLKIGMSEQELIEILGEPDFKDLVTTEIMSGQIQASQGNLWRYDYWPRAISLRAWCWDVFLDERTKTVVRIRRGEVIVD